MTIPIHHLWSKAVGTPEYVKKEWQDLEKEIEALDRAERRAQASATKMWSAGTVLAAFANTAPGRLPQTVQDAIADIMREYTS